MGILRTKTIEPATGSTLTLGASGDTITVSSDSIKANTFKDAGGNTLFTSDGAGTLSSVNSALVPTGPILISTSTASGVSSVDITSGIDSTYDEYMFVFSNMGPATEGSKFQFQVNATDDAGGDFDTSLITSTTFVSYSFEHAEQSISYGYHDGRDLAQSANFQTIANAITDDADSAASGYLNLYSPSSTTYVKHFTARFSTVAHHPDSNMHSSFWVAGYINDTTAIDEIRFKMD